MVLSNSNKTIFFFWKCCGFLCGIQKCPSIYLEETSALWVVASIVAMYCGLSEYLSVVFETFFSFSLLPRLLLISEWPADPVHHSAAWPEPQWDPAGKSCCCTCPRSLHPLLLPSSGQNLFFFFLILNHFRMELINHEIWDLNLFAMSWPSFLLSV